MPDNIEPCNLKGADLQLYRAARAFGLDVQILPVASLDRHGEYELGGSAASTLLSPSKLAVMLSFRDDPTAGYEWNYEEEGLGEFLKANIAEYCAPRINGELLWIKRPGKQHIKYCGPAKEYEGNSGCTTCFYAAAAVVLVTVPPVGAPKRQG
jgi:hypothetical protein